ncbi:MAG TPA: sensor histidine kinase [Marmoricola sp.]|nr:sensor histidine kinase [Marmoricola sp.]
MTASGGATSTPPLRFEHVAAFYAGPEGALGACLGFVREALQHREPVLVALAPERNEELRSALDDDADLVEFVDMTELGRNPARIIPRWQAFLEDAGGSGPVRGIGEPAWPGRTRDAYVEAALHESLLNLAFDDGRPWRLLCPYDLTGLPPDVLEEARRTHPVVHDEPSGATTYAGHGHAQGAFAAGLPAAPDDADGVEFDGADLGLVRDLVRRLAEASRLSPAAAENLALSVHELATNSVRHGGGHGLLSFWNEADGIVVEVRDGGHIRDPLVGRQLPGLMQEGGRGVWMANQLCDLVQVRSGEQGTQVRVRMSP